VYTLTLAEVEQLLAVVICLMCSFS
jgi:hypothetical protein